MFIKDCMCNKVYFAHEENKICDVVNMMDKNNIGFVPICNDDKKIIGIVTDRDILLNINFYNKDIKNDNIKSVMSTNVCCCKNTDDITNAKNIMCDHQIRRIPIVNDKDDLVGILTINDIAKMFNNKNEINQTYYNKKANDCNCGCEDIKSNCNCKESSNIDESISKEAVIDTINNICNCGNKY